MTEITTTEINKKEFVDSLVTAKKEMSVLSPTNNLSNNNREEVKDPPKKEVFADNFNLDHVTMVTAVNLPTNKNENYFSIIK